jgi:hypothetical protein
MSERVITWLLGVVAVLVCLLLMLGIFRLFFVDFVDNYELGYRYDLRSGQVEVLSESGYYVSWPVVVKIHTIDLRPGQVCMNANSRVLNCKLVRFNPNGFETFIKWHGRGAGSGGSNSGGDIYEILRSYAFNVNGGIDCPFLTIEDDMRKKDVINDSRTTVSAPASLEPSAPASALVAPTEAPASTMVK